VAPVSTGDVAKGKSATKRCLACHSLDARNKMGPGLKSVYNRKAGSVAGMKYSSSLAAADWSWDERNLAAWICDSKAAIKVLTKNNKAKTKMPAQRICDPTKQADVIAFMKTL